jgi:hypothetical protein
MSKRRMLLGAIPVVTTLIVLLILAFPYRHGYTRDDLLRPSPGMTRHEIEAILGTATLTDDLERNVPDRGEVRRQFWQITDDCWVLVGFGNRGRACWVLTHNPEALPEHPAVHLRRLFVWFTSLM